MASWLVRSSPDRAVRIGTLAQGYSVLFSWGRHFILTLPPHPSPQMYKWVTANLMLGVTLRLTNIPPKGVVEILLDTQHPTYRSMVAKRTQHVASNKVAMCCVEMLRSFCQGSSFTFVIIPPHPAEELVSPSRGNVNPKEHKYRLLLLSTLGNLKAGLKFVLHLIFLRTFI